MKKVLVLFAALAIMVTSFASVSPASAPKKPVRINAAQFFIPIGKTGQQISLMELSRIKVSDYEKLSGQNMNLSQKIGFKLAQRELRKNINPDGTLNSKRMERLSHKMQKPADSKTHKLLITWLVLLGGAIVLGIIAVFVPFVGILSGLAGLAALVFFVLWLISLSQNM